MSHGKFLIGKLFVDAQNNIDTGYQIEAAHDTGMTMIKISREDKTTADFLAGVKNEINYE